MHNSFAPILSVFAMNGFVAGRGNVPIRLHAWSVLTSLSSNTKMHPHRRHSICHSVAGCLPSLIILMVFLFKFLYFQCKAELPEVILRFSRHNLLDVVEASALVLTEFLVELAISSVFSTVAVNEKLVGQGFFHFDFRDGGLLTEADAVHVFYFRPILPSLFPNPLPCRRIVGYLI